MKQITPVNLKKIGFAEIYKDMLFERGHLMVYLRPEPRIYSEVEADTAAALLSLASEIDAKLAL